MTHLYPFVQVLPVAFYDGDWLMTPSRLISMGFITGFITGMNWMGAMAELLLALWALSSVRKDRGNSSHFAQKYISLNNGRSAQHSRQFCIEDLVRQKSYYRNPEQNMLVFSPDGLQQCFKVGKDVPLVSYNCDQLKLGRQIPNPRFSILLAVN